MADYNAYTETTTTRVITLDLPTNWVELQKAITAMRHDLEGRDLCDDSVTVDADDSTIRFTAVIGRTRHA